MIPSDYPQVVRDGLDGLRWVSQVQRRFADSLSKASRDPGSLPPLAPGQVIVWTPEWLTQAQATLESTIERVRRISDAQWTSGEAALFFTPVELELIEQWGYACSRIPDVGGEITAEERHQCATQIQALVHWLDLYLAQNG